jgi:esterase
VKLHHKKYPCTGTTSKGHLFILHGLFGMLDNWHNMARKFSKEYTVISLDQRNHGNSPHSDAMSFDLMADDIAELMHDLAIDKIDLLGHSMGGKVAMKFADRHPDKLDKLVIVDIAPKAYKPGHNAYFNAFHNLDFSQCETRKDADEALATIEPNVGIRQFLLKNLERAEQGYRLRFNLKPIEDFYPTMIAALEFEWLINAPTLFLYGEKSGYILERDIISIETTFTQAEFVCIADAGHWVHAEQPDAFAQAVLAFLS